MSFTKRADMMLRIAGSAKPLGRAAAQEDPGGRPVQSLFDLYQDRGFLDVFARYYGLEVVEIDGLLVCRRRRCGLGVVHSFCGGPEVSGPPDVWMSSARKAGGLYLRAFTNTPFPALDCFRLSEADTSSFFIDVSAGEEAAWRQMNKASRKAVRKSVRNGGTVRISTDIADLAVFLAIIHKTSRGGEKYEVPPRDYFESFLATGYGVLSLLEHEGTLVSGAFWLRGTHLHGMYGGSDRDRLRKVQSNLMFWEITRWAANEGVAGIDLGMQSVAALPELTSFKRSIGAVEIPAADYRIPLSAAKSVLLGLLRLAGKHPR